MWQIDNATVVGSHVVVVVFVVDKNVVETTNQGTIVNN